MGDNVHWFCCHDTHTYETQRGSNEKSSFPAGRQRSLAEWECVSQLADLESYAGDAIQEQ